jgi:hypothetical protein
MVKKEKKIVPAPAEENSGKTSKQTKSASPAVNEKAKKEEKKVEDIEMSDGEEIKESGDTGEES